MRPAGRETICPDLEFSCTAKFVSRILFAKRRQPLIKRRRIRQRRLNIRLLPIRVQRPRIRIQHKPIRILRLPMRTRSLRTTRLRRQRQRTCIRLIRIR